MQGNSFNNYVPRNQFSSYFNPSYPTSGVSTPMNNIIWVQGIEGAKAYQLSPNSMAILLDSEVEGKMYIKVSDNIGMSNLRIFNYTEELPTQVNINQAETIKQDLDLSQYVRKDELQKLLKEIIVNEQPIQSVAEGPVPGSSSDVPADKSKITFIKQS